MINKKKRARKVEIIMCKHWKYFCYQVDGNLGICRLSHEWCKNDRSCIPGIFGKHKKVRCNWCRRFYLQLRKLLTKLMR